MKDIQSVIDRLENINANLENPHMPDAIHVEALKEIVPEVIKDLKGLNNEIFFSVNGENYTRVDLEKAYESWNREFSETPENFYPDFKDTTGADSVAALIMYLEKTKSE